MDDLKSELSGNLERVIVGMMTPTVLYDVQELRRAMKVCARLSCSARALLLPGPSPQPPGGVAALER